MSIMTKQIPTPDELNRIVKILVDAGDAATIEEAERKLFGYSTELVIGEEAAETPAGQAALLTVIAIGRRALLGGVFVSSVPDAPLLVPSDNANTLREAVLALGGRLGETPPTVIPLIIIGDTLIDDRSAVALRCVFDGWRGGVLPADQATLPTGKNTLTIAGVLAGAIAVSEVFLHLRGGFAPAARRAVGMSLWSPGTAENWIKADAQAPKLELLPNSLWLIGLGHLGQAYLWVLSMLPYRNPEDLTLVLQDFDRLNLANESTSVLTTAALRDRPKTRAMAAWAEGLGFQTRLVERKFDSHFRVREDEPSLALCGVDNAMARSALEEVGFTWVIDAGLGAGPAEFQTMRLNTFPGPRAARKIWGKPAVRGVLPLEREAYQALSAAGLDQCGLVLLAERTVGAPFVGMIAACLVIAEIVRGLHGGRRIALLDMDLRSPVDRQVVFENSTAPNCGFCLPRN